jgi:hypothetical protein
VLRALANLASSEGYRVRGFGGGEVVPLQSAERPAPSNVTDGRFFGDELYAELFLPTTAATADAAAKLSAVHFCLSLIAEAGGNCPLDVTEDGKPVESPFVDALSYAPNPMQTAAEFWPSMLFRAALGGCAFAEPVIEGDEVYLWPLHPDRQAVEWRERGFTLQYTYQNGQTRHRACGCADAAADAVEDGERRDRFRARAGKSGPGVLPQRPRINGVLEVGQQAG